jgi:glycosyltransferase involved in cell wall biosynthesis
VSERSAEKLVVLCDWFPPAFRAGGPVRSCYNVAIGLSGRAQVWVATGDRDLDAAAPLEGVTANRWTELRPGVAVCYCSPTLLGWRRLWELRRRPATYYLNSLYSPRFTLLPLLAWQLGLLRGRMVLAPRGMLRPSALNLKAWKKRWFLWFFRRSGLARRLRFHATTAEEAADIRRALGDDVDIATVPVLPAAAPADRKPAFKPAGRARLAFVGRLHPIKNLDRVLDWLESGAVEGIELDVIGPAEDPAYAASCRRRAGALPPGIEVRFHGEVPFEQLVARLGPAHFLILPTRGENFGHAIYEALAQGKPVLISDQTPWRRLEAAGAGWDLPLGDDDAWLRALRLAVAMDDATYRRHSAAAAALAERWRAGEDTIGRYFRMFFQ